MSTRSLTRPDHSRSLNGHFDVLIVGAGISGIGVAHHLTTKQPGHSFAILEGRDAIGGTWDLFRYPGIRSDSDLHTFGYEFKPWTSKNAIADADEILDYLRETIAENDLARRIRFGHKVIGARLVRRGCALDGHTQRTDSGEQFDVTCSSCSPPPATTTTRAGTAPTSRVARTSAVWSCTPRLAGGPRLPGKRGRRHRQRRDGRHADSRDGRPRRPRDDVAALAELCDAAPGAGPDRQRR